MLSFLSRVHFFIVPSLEELKNVSFIGENAIELTTSLCPLKYLKI
jgi:hypothetical protein